MRDLVLQATESSEVIKYDQVQELWSGYGQIIRCWTKGGKSDSVILKHIQLSDDSNHPKGWNTDISHQRKLKSYHVEMSWYTGKGKHTSKYCRTPVLLHAQHNSEEIVLIMEDLDQAGFPVRKHEVNLQEMFICLKWLAYFHADYMNIKPMDLWDIGTYWHLATRPDELKIMTNKSLQKAAKAIDQKLNSAKFQTIVHGDAKLDNFCFSEDENQVAVVDFQYVGGGCGMKDFAYFISSCLTEDACEKYEKTLLSHYFECLNDALTISGKASIAQEIINEWSVLYRYAWADFFRFLDGWSPGHWKMHRYSTNLMEQVLLELHNSN